MGSSPLSYAICDSSPSSSNSGLLISEQGTSLVAPVESMVLVCSGEVESIFVFVNSLIYLTSRINLGFWGFGVLGFWVVGGFMAAALGRLGWGGEAGGSLPGRSVR